MPREMKDSGIEWIGTIPTSWSISKLKYVVDCKDSRRIPVDRNQREDGPYPYWGAGSITDYINDYIFDEDLVLLGEDGAPFFDKTRNVAHHINGKCWINNHIHVLSGKTGLINNSFLTHYLNIVDYKAYINGAILNKLTQTCMNEINIVLPTSYEQHLIADFLDIKCTEIDALSADIQKQIEKLEEYKRSVITEAVTKGLDPNVEMKDSAIEWIGKTPIGWTVSKLGNVLRLRNEKNTKPLEAVNLISLYTDKGVVQHSDLEKTSGNKAQKAEGYKIVHRNDIVVNIILAWMGAMGISNYDGVTSPAYDVYEIDLNKIVPHYCHYILRTPALAGECYKYGRGIMMMRWRTYSDEFKKIKMPLPSIEEQQKIADFLDLKCSQINEVIDKKNQQLSTLEEYKKSIIYEYVTGKKEVPADE